MIILHKLTWSNWFSFGDDNVVVFDETPLTQIIGKNGFGKTSIHLVLEEVLTNKNSKGIKKQDIVNWYSDNNTATAELLLSIDGTEFSISVKRSNTVKVTLLKGDEDISSHTSAGTYKTIEALLGIEFKVLTQLLYQSSTSSLQFLAATDTNRKKFLISLFNLDEYLEIHEVYKKAFSEVGKTVSSIEGSCNTVSRWIDSNKNQDIEDIDLVEIPESAVNELKSIGILEDDLKNIVSINRKVNNNNMYKQQLSKLDGGVLTEAVPEAEDISDTIKENQKDIAERSLTKAQIDKLNRVPDTCPTCKQSIDLTSTKEMLAEATTKVADLSERISSKATLISENASIKATYLKHNADIKEYENLLNYIDQDIEDDILDETDLKSRICELNKLIRERDADINKCKKHNISATAKNTENRVLLEQLDKYQSDLIALKEKLKYATDLLSSLTVLKQSFSTNGLIGYKLESLVQGLGTKINKYLTDLTDGAFYIKFALVGDKLNVEIIKKGKGISIASLSAGELARVNVSTLLAIRKMMAIISSTEVNTLFLDEIMGTLDLEGKDKLIEILLKEDLNTFLVSHEYSHPLVPYITVVKVDDISYIEE